MRALVPFTCVASVGFLLGFGAVRWGTAKTSLRVEPVSPVPLEEAPGMDAGPAVQSAERIETVLALGKEQQTVEQECQFYKELRKLDASELTAGADRFAALVQPNEFGGYSDLCEAWLDRWLEVDSPGALRWLEASSFLDGLYLPQNGPSLLSVLGGAQSSAFKILARRHPDWTRQYVSGMNPGAKCDVAVYQLISEVARQDAVKAKQWFESFAGSVNRGAAIQGYVTGLAASDVRAAFDTALQETPSPLRNELLESTLREAAKRGNGTVSELLDRIQDPGTRREMVAESALELSWHSREDLLPWLTEEAKRKVPAETNSQPFDTWSHSLSQALMTDNRDPEPAVTWAAQVENDPEQKLLNRMLIDWSRSDPEATRRWLSEHPAALERKEKLSSIILQMAQSDAAATWAWAESLPPGEFRDQARFQVVLGSGAERSFAEAVAAYHSIGSSDTKGEFAKQLAVVVARLDPGGAAQWALQMEPGTARSAAIATVTEQWSQSDPRAVASWIQTLPVGSDRDGAIREYAAKIVYADPNAAREWVSEVEDPKVRADAAAQVFLVWSWEDPVAPRAWLRSLPGIDEKWRADFLKKAP